MKIGNLHNIHQVFISRQIICLVNLIIIIIIIIYYASFQMNHFSKTEKNTQINTIIHESWLFGQNVRYGRKIADFHIIKVSFFFQSQNIIMKNGDKSLIQQFHFSFTYKFRPIINLRADGLKAVQLFFIYLNFTHQFF